MTESLLQIVSAEQAALMPETNACPRCGSVHELSQPHNAVAPRYLEWFAKSPGHHGRTPTWADAMAHCSPGVQAEWRALLKQCGIPVVPAPPVDRRHEAASVQPHRHRRRSQH
jgi:hypothetical protein